MRATNEIALSEEMLRRLIKHLNVAYQDYKGRYEDERELVGEEIDMFSEMLEASKPQKEWSEGQELAAQEEYFNTH